MLSITINNIKVHIYPYDDLTGVLRRYCLSLVPNPEVGKYTPTIPQYLRFTHDTSIMFVNKKNYSVIDIRNEITNMDVDTLTNEENLSKLKLHYPALTDINIILLWFISQDYSEMSRKEFIEYYNTWSYSQYLKKFKRETFTIGASAYDAMKEYMKKSADFVTQMHNAYVLENKIYKAFGGATKIRASNFSMEEIDQEIIVKFEGYTLYDIFDAITLSENIPFVMLVDKIREPYYNSFSSDLDINNKPLKNKENIRVKIYNEIVPPDEWILETRPKTGLYFYILNSSHQKLFKEKSLFNPDYTKLYNICTWDEKGKIEITISSDKQTTKNSNNTDILQNILFESLGDRIIYEIEHIKQVGVKGTINIPNITFNKAVFADLIFNNPFVRYYAFLDEEEKSSLDKPKFIFYFEANHQAVIETALTITVTPQIENENSSIDVRVARASTLTQVNAFIKVFEGLCGIYLDEKQNIEDLYITLYPKITFKGEYKKARAKKEDTKSGIRLKNLIKKNSVAFGNHYSSKCQPEHVQPYLVDPVNLERLGVKPATLEGLKKQMEKFQPGLSNAGLVNWPLGTKDWYSCWPREKLWTDENGVKHGDKNQRYIYAAVIERDKRVTDAVHPYKYLPCCKLQNQYTKPTGSLQKYFKWSKSKKNTSTGDIVPDSDTQDTKDEDNINEVVINRPLGVDKPAPKGRYAKISHNLQLIAIGLGYSFIEKEKELFLPILRHGVVSSPDSFVHCMEKATNDEYSYKTNSKGGSVSTLIIERKEIVANTLQTISELEHFAVGKQELFGVSDEQIREHLVSGDYIDPREFISIFEMYYGCNIILFEMNNGSIDGEFVIPNFSIAYLPRKLDLEIPTILINLFQTESVWPYQCELIVKVDEDGNIYYSFDSNDEFITELINIREQVNTVYFTAPNGKYYKYVPQTII